ncbi:MAG TPA: GtrA family protein [Solirubrobacteraceae bacterium]|nr:GtrA family protein [Solirubrobacteraceae bacterium]
MIELAGNDALERDQAAREPPAGVGLFGRIVRFALAGGTVAAVYLLVTLLLAKVVGLPFQAALAIGFTTALGAHFTLQRLFVWVHHEEFALSLRTQAGRYLAISLTQYGLTAATTGLLPDALGISTEIVYVVTTALITVANFVLFRTRVFHPEKTLEG